MTKVKGTFESRWAEGVVSTSATLDPDTGEISTSPVDVGEEYGHLLSEVFIDEFGEELNVCSECHEFLTKSVIVDDEVGNGMHEEESCMNPDCSGHI